MNGIRTSSRLSFVKRIGASSLVVASLLMLSACDDAPNSMHMSSATWDKAWQSVYASNTQASLNESTDGAQARRITKGPIF
jgi:hypothetical protein